MARDWNTGGLLKGRVFPRVVDSDANPALFLFFHAGIRMLDRDVTDVMEAQSLSFRPHYVDIYLASWGPEDDGATLEGLGPLTLLALQNGVQNVRKEECL